MRAQMKYFSGDTELCSLDYMRKEEFAAKFPDVKGFRVDSVDMLVGYAHGNRPDPLPVTRRISYTKRSDAHKCDARCRNAKPDGPCECSCGGKNHGIGNDCMVERKAA